MTFILFKYGLSYSETFLLVKMVSGEWHLEYQSKQAGSDELVSVLDECENVTLEEISYGANTTDLLLTGESEYILTAVSDSISRVYNSDVSVRKVSVLELCALLYKPMSL